jgi:hypothetical protein
MYLFNTQSYCLGYLLSLLLAAKKLKGMSVAFTEGLSDLKLTKTVTL